MCSWLNKCGYPQKEHKHSVLTPTVPVLLFPPEVIDLWEASTQLQVIQGHMRTNIFLPSIVNWVVVPRGELACKKKLFIHIT